MAGVDLTGHEPSPGFSARRCEQVSLLRFLRIELSFAQWLSGWGREEAHSSVRVLSRHKSTQIAKCFSSLLLWASCKRRYGSENSLDGLGVGNLKGSLCLKGRRVKYGVMAKTCRSFLEKPWFLELLEGP